MTRTILTALATSAIALALLASAQASTKVTKLVGTVGPGFDITLKSGGKTVTRLKPGTYALTVSDKSSIHNYHLTGPGLNKMVTGVSFTGSKTITLKLKAGKYKYQCDPHSFSMHGAFAVK